MQAEPWTLLLADEPTLFVAAHGSFLMRAAARVVTASSAQQAIERARLERPALAVFDADGWGIAALRGMRAEPRTASIPVLLAATRAGDPEPRATWLVRPIDSASLGRAASRILGAETRATDRRAAALRAICFHGDRETRAVTKDVSNSGLFLRIRERLEPGAAVHVIVDLGEEPKVAVRAAAEVSRVVPDERDSHLVPGVGLRFVRVGRRDRAKIERFVATGEAGD